VSIHRKTRELLYQRAHGGCEMCGKWAANNAHHRKNRSQGGEDTLSNLLLLCGSGTTGCHGWVTEHPEESVSNGWSIHGRIAVPADVKVLRFDRVLGVKVWALLTDDGGTEAAS
jgi:hypothetical protein